MLRPTSLAWSKPRRELVLLTLVAVAALTPVFVISTQDVSHYCLSRALVAGTVAIGPCAGETVDVSEYHGRIYTNKAPGLSALAVPAVEIARLPSAAHWDYDGDSRVWLVRVLTNGIAFLVCAWLVGRVAEGLVPGTGPPVLATFALGTLAMPLAATGFDHDVTMAFGFGAFVLAWARRPALAGLAAGIAYAVEYEAASLVGLIGLYVLLSGLRPLGRYVAGAVPPVAASAAYSWAAFGEPWRNPHSYLAHTFSGVHEGGLLGVHFPSLNSIRLVFVGDRGLLVTAPVLVAAAAGLWLLWRRGLRAESLLCALVTAAFVVGEMGYGDPYGGLSPGPRYLIPALPFLAVGLAAAFERRRVATAILGGLSVIAATTLTLTWAQSGGSAGHYRNSVWGEIARFFRDTGRSRLYDDLANNILLGMNGSRIAGAALVSVCAAGAYLLALRRS